MLQVRPHRGARQRPAVERGGPGARRRSRGTSILTADLGAYRRRLLDSPWVADVALRRVLPSTIEVFVSERRPIGLCRLGQPAVPRRSQRASVIDEFGPQYAEFDLPIIDGLVRPPQRGKPAIDERRAELAARVIDAVAEPQELRSGSRRSTSATSTTPSCCSKRTPRCCTSEASAFSNGCSRMWSSPPRCGNGCRRSITSTSEIRAARVRAAGEEIAVVSALRRT